MTDTARAPGTVTPAPHAPHHAPLPAPSSPVEPDCPDPGLPGDRAGTAGQTPGSENGGCTQAQLRRFVKSRPYVPLHELRRRFGIGGPEDDVSPIAVDGRTLFIGLPEREAGMMGDLIRAGDAGYELLLDPDGPMIVGVWPMRPVQRT